MESIFSFRNHIFAEIRRKNRVSFRKNTQILETTPNVPPARWEYAEEAITDTKSIMNRAKHETYTSRLGGAEILPVT